MKFHVPLSTAETVASGPSGVRKKRVSDAPRALGGPRTEDLITAAADALRRSMKAESSEWCVGNDDGDFWFGEVCVRFIDAPALAIRVAHTSSMEKCRSMESAQLALLSNLLCLGD